MRRFILFGLSLLWIVVSCHSAPAAIMTFRAEWDGSGLGNTAYAVAIMTIDTTRFPNPGNIAAGNFDSVVPPAFQSLNMTLSGAASGNGTYTLGDYTFFSWSTNGGVLDFNRELVGQPTLGDTWADTGSFNAGEFSLYANNPSAPSSAYSPFALRTSAYEYLRLTTFTPLSAPTAVPEPSSMLFIAFVSASAHLLNSRRRRQASAASARGCKSIVV